MFEERELSMTNAQLQKASKRILKALNDAQFVDGHTVDEVLMAALFIVGAGLKRRGAVLQLDAPLRMAIPPLVNGYEAEAKRMGQQ